MAVIDYSPVDLNYKVTRFEHRYLIARRVNGYTVEYVAATNDPVTFAALKRLYGLS